MPSSCWLMKAEPESRLEKGVDVKFSIDDLEAIGTSKWDGVRNHEAKKIMQEKMKVGDRVLFYHSNCKTPGVYGLATVSREGYPDFTAWDPSHPYYDPRSNKDKPTWFMVDITFQSRLAHPVTLAALKHLVTLDDVPETCSYVGKQGLEEIKRMALVNRGRLSVQPVSDAAYDLIVKIGERGGLPTGEKKKKAATETKKGSQDTQPSRANGAAPDDEKPKPRVAQVDSPSAQDGKKAAKKAGTKEGTTSKGKRTAPTAEEDDDENPPRRRSTRLRRA